MKTDNPHPDLETIRGHALFSNNENILNMIDSLSDAFFAIDLNGTVVVWNHAAEKLTGVSQKEILGKGDYAYAVPFYGARRPILVDLVHCPDDGIKEKYASIKKGGSFLFAEEYATALSARNAPCFSAVAGPLFDAKGKISGAFECLHSIAEYKQVEGNDRDCERKCGSLLDIAREGVFQCTSQGRFISVNAALSRMYGYESAAEMVAGVDSITGQLLADPRDWQILRSLIERNAVIKGHKIRTLRKDGSTIWVSLNAQAIRDSQGGICCIEGTLEDISQRRENELITQRYRLLSENTREIILFVGEDGRILDVNRTALAAYGHDRDALLSMTIFDLRAPHLRKTLQRDLKIAFSKGMQIETEHVRKDGALFPVEVSAHPADIDGDQFILSIVRDISARKTRETLNLHIQKLESVGQLAAGIAHEINTPIQFISDNTRFVREAFQDIVSLISLYTNAAEEETDPMNLHDRGKQLRTKADEIDLPYLLKELPMAIEQSLEGLERVIRIVKSLREFSHPGQTEKIEYDLNKAVESTVTLSRNEWKYTTDLTTSLDPALPLVTCYPADINQVILNLIINAAQAIRENTAGESPRMGRIMISTKQEGNEAVLSVSDTGTGIPPEAQPHIFNPFFTTKEVGKGTGQGLTIAHNIIVKKHGGKISFVTTPGEGTTFEVRLPLGKQGPPEDNPAFPARSGLTAGD